LRPSRPLSSGADLVLSAWTDRVTGQADIEHCLSLLGILRHAWMDEAAIKFFQRGPYYGRVIRALSIRQAVSIATAILSSDVLRGFQLNECGFHR
jgi:hypothetical protein